LERTIAGRGHASARSAVIGFSREGPSFVCDGVPLARIAGVEETPFYVYSAALIRDRYRAIDAALGPYPHAVHYALKANSTLAVLRLLRALGAGADANSGGEIDVALRAGFIPPQIVFTGVGKSDWELERAIELGVRTINAESGGELDRIDRLARAQGGRARVALRVNPDVDAGSHPHISTGRRADKFGVPLEAAFDILIDAARKPGLLVAGLHVHVGSQIVTLDPLRAAASRLVALAGALRTAGVPIEHLDVGGGLGISYDGTPVPTPAEYASAIIDVVGPSGLPLLVEPGRAIAGPAGALVGRVVDVKPQRDGKHFVVLDAGMTELMRPALYGAYHRIEPVERGPGAETACDIVGPLCESSDTLGLNRRMPLPAPGDLLAVLDAGAYGAVMASNYNRRPLPAEVLVDEGRWRAIRRRQSIDEMLQWEE
jgi:diaminopimelate decarboxylase